jgi:hypothetical protein
MTITINKKAYEIKAISELTFEEFNKIVVLGSATDLKEYLALFCDIPLEELLASELKGASIPALHKMIFNVDIESVLKDKKHSLQWNDKTLLMSDISMKTLGNSYMFEIYRQAYEAKKINQYELCIYALAIALTNTQDMSVINKACARLKQSNWMKVLPQGFFLVKNSSLRRINLMKISMLCTWGLRLTTWKWRTSRIKYSKLERI